MIADVEGVELKPCPFCGSQAVLRTTAWDEKDILRRYWAKCSNDDCGITTKAVHPPDMAMKAWNDRTA